MNRIIKILDKRDWEQNINKYLKDHLGWEWVFKNILEIRLAEWSKYTDLKYFVNLVLYSFYKDELNSIPFQIKQGIQAEIFEYLPEQLEKFSFSRAMVENSIGKIIVFTKSEILVEKENKEGEFDTFNNTLERALEVWLDIYFKDDSTEKGRRVECCKGDLRDSHILSIDKILNDPDTKIKQVSFIPILTGSTQKKVGGVFALNSNCTVNELNILGVLRKIISGIISYVPVQELEHLNLQANRKAAIAQVRARNYAHHIGSHVKNRTTLNEIRKRISKLYS